MVRDMSHAVGSDTVDEPEQEPEEGHLIEEPEREAVEDGDDADELELVSRAAMLGHVVESDVKSHVEQLGWENPVVEVDQVLVATVVTVHNEKGEMQQRYTWRTWTPRWAEVLALIRRMDKEFGG